MDVTLRYLLACVAWLIFVSVGMASVSSTKQVLLSWLLGYFSLLPVIVALIAPRRHPLLTQLVLVWLGNAMLAIPIGIVAFFWAAPI